MAYIEKIVQAIEADGGMALTDLRQGLAEMQDGIGQTHSPEQILLRSVRQQTGLSQQAFADLIKTSVATYATGNRAGLIRRAV